MNLKTFNTKESLYLGLPVLLGDLAIYVGTYLFWTAHFTFTVREDLVLRNPKCLVFLMLGFALAQAILPSRIYERGYSWKEQMLKVFLQALLTLMMMALTTDILFHSFAGFFFLYAGMTTVVLVALWHMIFRGAIIVARRRGRNKIHVVVVGDNERARELATIFGRRSEYEDYKLVASFGAEVDAVEEFLSGNKVHQLYCCLSSDVQAEQVNRIIRCCENLFIEFYYVPALGGYLRHSVSFSELGPFPVLKLREEPLSLPLNAAFKRGMDILFSGLFLVTAFPLVWLFVAIGTTISSPGPIFFKQKRTGYKGRPFTMYKFRSMRVNADADRLQATADDPRKTRFGNFLRRTSLDELPQFINVFRGDMSVVGPRPHMELHTQMYTKLVDEYLVRHMVKPGLTGWAQVNGCRGETRTTEAMAERVRHDIWYIEHWSAALDVRIVLMTIWQIILGDKQAY